jgi:hypothetical protein
MHFAESLQLARLYGIAYEAPRQGSPHAAIVRLQYFDYADQDFAASVPPQDP